MSEPVVSDVAAQKIALAIGSSSTAIAGAIAGHAAALDAIYNSLNPLGGGKPGSIATLISSQETQLVKLTNAVVDNTKATRELIAATGKIANSVEALMKPASTMAVASINQVSTAQLALADQQKANLHNQKTVEAAQERAGVPKTVVTLDDQKAAAGANVQAALGARGTAASAEFVASNVIEYTKKGFELAVGWVAESAFGKWLESYYKETIVQVQLLWADKEAKEKLEKELSEIRSKRNNPKSAT